MAYVPPILWVKIEEEVPAIAFTANYPRVG